jgi:hypothetical protein
MLLLTIHSMLINAFVALLLLEPDLLWQQMGMLLAQLANALVM